jgi:hypothetical protein
MPIGRIISAAHPRRASLSRRGRTNHLARCCMLAWLHLASRGTVVALYVTGPTKRERARWARRCCYPF